MLKTAVGAKRMDATPHEGNVTKRRSIESKQDGTELVKANPGANTKLIKKKATEKSEKKESISKPRRNQRKSDKEESEPIITVRRSRRLKFDSPASSR